MGLTTATKIKISKLDSRHTGNRWFTHRASFEGTSQGRAKNLCQAREWLWATLGPSREVTSIGYFPEDIPQWAWQTEFNHYRLYLTEHALTQFLLVKDRFEQPGSL